MSSKPIILFPSATKLKIIKFVIKHFNNFTFGSHTDINITVNQPIPTKTIIAFSNFAIRNKLELEINDKTLTFQNPLNNE
jgi:hypothetical protein